MMSWEVRSRNRRYYRRCCCSRVYTVPIFCNIHNPSSLLLLSHSDGDCYHTYLRTHPPTCSPPCKRLGNSRYFSSCRILSRPLARTFGLLCRFTFLQLSDISIPREPLPLSRILRSSFYLPSVNTFSTPVGLMIIIIWRLTITDPFREWR